MRQIFYRKDRTRKNTITGRKKFLSESFCQNRKSVSLDSKVSQLSDNVHKKTSAKSMRTTDNICERHFPTGVTIQNVFTAKDHDSQSITEYFQASEQTFVEQTADGQCREPVGTIVYPKKLYQFRCFDTLV